MSKDKQRREYKKPKTAKLISTHSIVSAKGKTIVTDIKFKGNKIKLHKYAHE